MFYSFCFGKFIGDVVLGEFQLSMNISIINDDCGMSL
jgi:hypothetical protein